MAPWWSTFTCEFFLTTSVVLTLFPSTNDESGKVTTDKLAYHGCEKDLAGALGATFDVICGGHTNACYNISREEIQDDFLVRAEACFCEGDR